MPFEPYSPETPTVSAALALARRVEALLAVPERWCQGVLRWKDEDAPGDADAYCLVGALAVCDGQHVAYGQDFPRDFSPEGTVVRARMRKVCRGDLMMFNDNRQHPEIAALTRATRASFE